MYHHIELGSTPEERKKELGKLIHSRAVSYGGYKIDKIYGLLNCSSGKRMKVENRIFFKDEAEAVCCGYRPCGHCMPNEYRIWKANKKRSTLRRHKDNFCVGESYLLGGL